MAGRAQKMQFEGSLGHPLVGWAELPPDGQPIRAWALFAHCFTCTKDLRSAKRITTALAKDGYAVLRFDFTGLGESEGDFTGTDFSSNRDDLIAAANHLRAHEEAPRLLIGHSLGGTAALSAAPHIPEVVAVAVLGAPSSPAHLAEGILGDVDRDAALSSVLLGGRTFTIRRELFADLEGHRLTETLGALRRALLVMHSPVDKVVSVDHAREIFQAAKHPKSFVALDGADHLLLERPLDADFAASMLATWAARYIPADEPPARDARGLDSRTEKSPLPEGVVEVESVDGARFAQRVRTRGHVLKTDEPASFGGADSGPAPYEMLLAGLGSCISMTLRIVADREEIPLESVRVRLRHARVHAQDCAECETKKGRIDRIEKELWLDGPLDQAQRQRLLKVSSRCPVHRTLTSETQIVAVDEIGAGEG